MNPIEALGTAERFMERYAEDRFELASAREAAAVLAKLRPFVEAAMELARMRREGVEFSVFEHSERTTWFDTAYRALIADADGPS